MDVTPTIEAALKQASTSLMKNGSESPSLDAAVLLCHVLNKPRSYLLTWPEKHLTQQENSQFSSLLERRLQGEPIAYITGEREFWSLPLMVSPSTLIPRPDTERLVELALEKLPMSPSHILDLGTGTGAIALAIASECPQHKVLGIDLEVQAKELAERNANKLNIHNAQFLHGSWFDPLRFMETERDSGIKSGIKFAVIVSNPPYIEQNDPHLSKGDVRFEPISALVANEKGLSDIRQIIAGAVDYIEKGGWLLIEHGFEQGADVRCLMEELSYTHVSTEKDYAGNDRVTLGQYCAIQ